MSSVIPLIHVCVPPSCRAVAPLPAAALYSCALQGPHAEVDLWLLRAVVQVVGAASGHSKGLQLHYARELYAQFMALSSSLDTPATHLADLLLLVRSAACCVVQCAHAREGSGTRRSVATWGSGRSGAVLGTTTRKVHSGCDSALPRQARTCPPHRHALFALSCRVHDPPCPCLMAVPGKLVAPAVLHRARQVQRGTAARQQLCRRAGPHRAGVLQYCAGRGRPGGAVGGPAEEPGGDGGHGIAGMTCSAGGCVWAAVRHRVDSHMGVCNIKQRQVDRHRSRDLVWISSACALWDACSSFRTRWACAMGHPGIVQAPPWAPSLTSNCLVRVGSAADGS